MLKPTLLGITDNEGDGVTNWDPVRGVNKSLSAAITTTFFNCPLALEASFRVQHGVPVWRYRNMGVFPSVTPYPWLGAYHSCEIFQVPTHDDDDHALCFGTLTDNLTYPADIPFALGSPFTHPNGSASPPLSQREVAARDYLQAALAAFIRDPVRGLEVEMGWPRYRHDENDGSGQTLVELFAGQSANASFVDPAKYDGVCLDPPPICWECYLEG
jgi:hypothetical protein